LLKESVAVNRRYHDRWGLAMGLTVLGHVSLADSDHTRARALLAEAASQFADTGNLMYLQWCLEGLAGAAAARGEYQRAAELDGARDVLRAQLGVLLPPIHPAGYAQTLAAILVGLTQRLSTRPTPDRPTERHSKSSRQPQATRTRRQDHPGSGTARTCRTSGSARWQFCTGRYLVSADRACWKQRMNAPGLVRHLRDPQVEHRAGQRQRRCLANSVGGLQPGQHRFERVCHGCVEIWAEAKGDLASWRLRVHPWHRPLGDQVEL
jgi:hypothetical protein